MAIQHVNAISNQLSLRSPQRESLEILARVCEIVTLEKTGSRGDAECIRNSFVLAPTPTPR